MCLLDGLSTETLIHLLRAIVLAGKTFTKEEARAEFEKAEKKEDEDNVVR